jgi:hypothetical protein
MGVTDSNARMSSWLDRFHEACAAGVAAADQLKRFAEMVKEPGATPPGICPRTQVFCAKNVGWNNR